MIASVGLRIYNLVEPHVAAGFPDYILADLPGGLSLLVRVV